MKRWEMRDIVWLTARSILGYGDNYVCIGNVWERDENWKFVRFIWMEEAFDIINNWVIDPNIHLKSKQDKKREKQKEQPLF